MHRWTSAARDLAGTDSGQSLVELSVKLVLAFVLVGTLFVAYHRIAAGGHVPLEQCIEHQSCAAAQQAHGF